MDFNYAVFIKEQTGHIIDLFEQLEKNIPLLIHQDEILTREEWEHAIRMKDFCEKTHDLWIQNRRYDGPATEVPSSQVPGSLGSAYG